MRKIYLASSWKNSYQPVVLEMLREAGHEVYDFRNPKPGNKGFSWSHIDSMWNEWTNTTYTKALEHPVAEDGFKLDFDAMQWANTCVLLLPSGRSAHVEAGWMKGAGKQVFVFTADDHHPELMYKVFDKICVFPDQLLKALSQPITIESSYYTHVKSAHYTDKNNLQKDLKAMILNYDSLLLKGDDAKEQLIDRFIKDWQRVHGDNARCKPILLENSQTEKYHHYDSAFEANYLGKYDIGFLHIYRVNDIRKEVSNVH